MTGIVRRAWKRALRRVWMHARLPECGLIAKRGRDRASDERAGFDRRVTAHFKEFERAATKRVSIFCK
jgi:hypothetical protein